MKIIAFEVEDWERQTFERLQGEHRIEFVADPLTLENAGTYAEVEVVCPFIHSDLSANVLKHFGRLRLIATRSTLQEEVDAFGVSFAETGEDILKVKRFAQEKGQSAYVVAKIERAEAIENLDGILSAADAIMIGFVLRENESMLALGKKLGFQVKTQPDAQELELVITLASLKGGLSRARQQP